MSLDVPGEFTDLVAAVFGDRLELARHYAKLLAVEGIDWGLIGPREADRVWERHIVNSLCLTPLVPHGAVVVDAGSGAGLPGIPLALARPDLRLTLVEPMARRVDFLDLCVERLGLSQRVRVVRARVEDYRGRPDVVTCRAVASVDRLVEWVGWDPQGGKSSGRSKPVSQGARLVPPGELLAVKGERAALEIEQAEPQLHRRGLVADVLRPEVSGQVVGTVVRIKAVGKKHSIN